MNISKKSWHFRFRRWIGESSWQIQDDNTLCSYFWGVVWAFVRLASAIAAVLYLSYALVGIAPAETFKDSSLYEAFSDGYWYHLIAAVAFYGIVVALVVVMLGIAQFIKWNACRTKKPKKPSLILAYIQAKKEKVCPLLDFKD